MGGSFLSEVASKSIGKVSYRSSAAALSPAKSVTYPPSAKCYRNATHSNFLGVFFLRSKELMMVIRDRRLL
jgi:hypothetical protein